MKFTLTIEFGNDAMRTSGDLAAALRSVGTRVRAAIPHVVNREDAGPIRDANGNTVGAWKVEP